MDRKLCLSRDNKIIAGVCGGIADYFGFDPTLIRIVWAMLTLMFFGTPIFLYILFWAIMPQRD